MQKQVRAATGLAGAKIRRVMVDGREHRILLETCSNKRKKA
jgi:hypothetical protein